MDIRRALNKARKAGASVNLQRGGRGLFGVSGIPLAVGKELVLLRNTPDFQLDGYVILPIASIKSLRSNEFERFFERVVLERYGRTRLLKGGPKLDLTDWPSFFGGFVGKPRLFTVKAEREPHSDFMVGRIIDSTDRRVTMRAISPLATWYEQPASLLHRRITIVTFDDDYTSVFAKYAK